MTRCVQSLKIKESKPVTETTQVGAPLKFRCLKTFGVPDKNYHMVCQHFSSEVFSELDIIAKVFRTLIHYLKS